MRFSWLVFAYLLFDYLHKLVGLPRIVVIVVGLILLIATVLVMVRDDDEVP